MGAVSKSGAIQYELRGFLRKHELKFNEWFVRYLAELFQSVFALKGLHIPAQGQRSATLG